MYMNPLEKGNILPRVLYNSIYNILMVGLIVYFKLSTFRFHPSEFSVQVVSIQYKEHFDGSFKD